MPDAASTFTIQIEVDPGNARNTAASIFSELRRASTGLDTEINKIERATMGVMNKQQEGTKSAAGWSQTLTSGYKQVLQADQKYYAQNVNSIDGAIAAREREGKQFSQGLQARLNLAQADGKLAAQQDKAIGQRDAHVKSFQAYNQQQQTASQQTALYNQYLYDQEKAANRAAQGLSTTRYALYDVSSTLTATGGLLLGMATATAAVAIAWERDFAQVIRTTGVTGDAVGVLRADLVDLAQTMPVAFGDLTQIATLAGQLGIAKENVASFTETVAKFSAVTDLSVEASATAFGRLDALLPDVDGNFEALGSSIAKVGVESVATESQIVNVATQISSMGAYAGLTADQVIGLSGALASIGGAPELSRGTVTRLFTQMSKAISDGGDRLNEFARISGVSAEEFASAFGTSRFGPIFQSFIEGLNDTSKTGGDAVATLDKLGITSVRDAPLLLRLAGAGDLLADSFDNAASGFSGAAELNRQYGEISETTAAKLQILTNNFMALLDAIGTANLGPLNTVLDGLSGFLGFLTDMASTDIGGGILGTVTILAGLAGVAGIVAGGLALMGASMIGMQQGLAGIVAIAPGAAARILGVGTASAIAGGGASAATASFKLLGTAIKALTVVGALLILPDVMQWGADVARGASGVDTSITAMSRRVKTEFSDLNKSMLDVGPFAATINRAFAGADAGILRDVKELDEQLTSLVEGGNAELARSQFDDLKNTWVSGGGDLETFNRYFTDTNTALREAGNSAATGSSGFKTFDEAMAASTAEAQATEDAINSLKDAILNFANTSITAEEAELGFQAALNSLNEAAAGADVTLNGTNAASLSFRQSLIDMDKAARDSAVAIIDNGGSMEEATGKYNTAREAIIAARIAKGEDAVQAGIWADKVLGSSQEAQAALQAYFNKVNSTPESKVTRFYVDASGAYRDVNNLVNYINSRTATMTVTQRVIYESSVLSGGRGRQTFATGGYVTGPGTRTSDSIPARLSNGEYVVKASAVDKYGVGFLNALNTMKVPKFANGGQVGGGASSSGPVMGAVVELGPKSLARLGQEVTNNILLDDIAISRASQRGDRKRRAAGDIR